MVFNPIAEPKALAETFARDSLVLFLGYDPGGKSTHGVAALEISETGELVKPPVCSVLQDAKAVLEWMDMHGNVAALGIDTLMAWSPTGSRECDDRLRKKYPEQASSIIPQNSLYSSMTLNGAMVAQHAYYPDLREPSETTYENPLHF